MDLLTDMYRMYVNLLWDMPVAVDLAISTIVFLATVMANRTDSVGHNIIFIIAALVLAVLWGPLTLVLLLTLPPAAAIWTLAYLIKR